MELPVVPLFRVPTLQAERASLEDSPADRGAVPRIGVNAASRNELVARQRKIT